MAPEGIPLFSVTFHAPPVFKSDKLTDLKKSAELAIDQGKSVVFDLSACTEIDSHALGFLVQLRNKARKANLDLYLLSPSEVVMRLINVTRLEKSFTIVQR